MHIISLNTNHCNYNELQKQSPYPHLFGAVLKMCRTGHPKNDSSSIFNPIISKKPTGSPIPHVRISRFRGETAPPSEAESALTAARTALSNKDNEAHRMYEDNASLPGTFNRNEYPQCTRHRSALPAPAMRRDTTGVGGHRVGKPPGRRSITPDPGVRPAW